MALPLLVCPGVVEPPARTSFVATAAAVDRIADGLAKLMRAGLAEAPAG